jgi:hypothetical protein
MATNPRLCAADRKEAVRLAWKSRHIPIGTILLGTMLLSGVISATSTMWSYGPAIPMP